MLQVRSEGGLVNTVLQYRKAMKEKGEKPWCPDFEERKKEVKENEKKGRGGVTRELVTEAVNSSYLAQFGTDRVRHGKNKATTGLQNNEKGNCQKIRARMMARDLLCLAPGIRPKVVAKKGAAREQVWRRLAGLQEVEEEEEVEGEEREVADGDRNGKRRERGKDDELVGFLPYFPAVKLSKYLDEKANR